MQCTRSFMQCTYTLNLIQRSVLTAYRGTEWTVWWMPRLMGRDGWDCNMWIHIDLLFFEYFFFLPSPALNFIVSPVQWQWFNSIKFNSIQLMSIQFNSVPPCLTTSKIGLVGWTDSQVLHCCCSPISPEHKVIVWQLLEPKPENKFLIHSINGM